MLKWLALTLLTACTTAQLMDPAKLYKKEIEMVVNGHKAKGVQAELRDLSYKISFELPEKPSIIKITSCHREDTFRDLPNRKLEYVYTPVVGIEDRGYCPLEIGAFDASGAHSWGIIDFQDDEKIRATVYCNGQNQSFFGVSICQTRYGLIQGIKFGEPVRVYTNDNCAKADTKDAMRFEIEASRDKCVYLFTNGKDHHRLTLFGYDEVYIK